MNIIIWLICTTSFILSLKILMFNFSVIHFCKIIGTFALGKASAEENNCTESLPAVSNKVEQAWPIHLSFNSDHRFS